MSKTLVALAAMAAAFVVLDFTWISLAGVLLYVAYAAAVVALVVGDEGGPRPVRLQRRLRPRQLGYAEAAAGRGRGALVRHDLREAGSLIRPNGIVPMLVCLEALAEIGAPAPSPVNDRPLGRPLHGEPRPPSRGSSLTGLGAGADSPPRA